MGEVTHPSLYTMSDDKYRSDGERKIGSFLEEAGLDFEYEAPLLVRDRGRPRIWYPDFRLSDYRTLIEYFGVRDDPSYEQMKRRKATVYRNNNIPVLFLTEPDLRGDWKRRLLDDVGEMLRTRYLQFRETQDQYLRSKSQRISRRDIPF